jgi:hypothetical protein
MKTLLTTTLLLCCCLTTFSQGNYSDYSSSEKSIVFFDDFDSNPDRKTLFDSYEPLTDNLRGELGKFHTSIQNGNFKYECFDEYNRVSFGSKEDLKLYSSEDWEIETRIKWEEAINSPEFMLGWRVAFDQDGCRYIGEQYRFWVKYPNFYSIGVTKGNDYSKFVNYTNFASFQGDSWNTLTIRKVKDNCYFFINNTFVNSFKYSETLYVSEIDFRFLYGQTILIDYLKISKLIKNEKQVATVFTSNTTSRPNAQQVKDNGNSTETDAIVYGSWSNWFNLVDNSNIQYSIKTVDYYNGTMYALAFRFRNLTNKRVSFNFRYGIPGKASVVEMLAGSSEGIWYKVSIEAGQAFEPSMLDVSSGLLSKNELNNTRMFVKDFKIEERTLGSEAIWSAGIALGAYFIVKEVGEYISNSNGNSSNSNNSSSSSKDAKIYVGSQVRCIGHWQGNDESGYYGRVIEISGDKYKIKIDKVVVKSWTQTALVGSQCTDGYDLVLLAKDIDLNQMKAGKGSVIWVRKNCFEKYEYQD